MAIPQALLPHTVTHVRPAETTDAYGNTTWDYGDAATRREIRAWIDQRRRAEQHTDGRDPLIQDWLLVTNDADIGGRDRIEWDHLAGTVVFEVEGPPAPYHTPAGYHHTEATLRKVTG